MAICIKFKQSANGFEIREVFENNGRRALEDFDDGWRRGKDEKMRCEVVEIEVGGTEVGRGSLGHRDSSLQFSRV